MEEPLASDTAPITLDNPIEIPHGEVMQHCQKEPSLESCSLGDLLHPPRVAALNAKALPMPCWNREHCESSIIAVNCRRGRAPLSP